MKGLEYMYCMIYLTANKPHPSVLSHFTLCPFTLLAYFSGVPLSGLSLSVVSLTVLFLSPLHDWQWQWHAAQLQCALSLLFHEDHES